MLNSMMIIYVLLALAAGFFIGWFFRIEQIKARLKDAEEKAKRILHEAEKEAEAQKKEAVLEAKDRLYQAKAEFEKETRERRAELTNLEKRFIQREEHLDKKLDILDKRESELMKKERDILNRERSIVEKEESYKKILQEQRELLEKISGMNSVDAKNELMRRIEEETRFEAAKLIKRVEDETKEVADKKAKEIIAQAIQRYSSDYVIDATVTVVNLPNDEMKGRIIGREGRNIRALESTTGIDLIIDDTPEAVILSGFDSIRREIARIALERLISDGRIHPARIEEIVEKVKKEIEDNIREEGEKAVFDLSLHGIHHEIVRLLGKLRYRTSYGQNVLVHSREVAYLAGIMAGELKVDIKLAKRAGLLHDIGKAMDYEVEGSHPAIGADLAKKYGENHKVINAIASHHEDTEPATIEAVLVSAADTLSASRPGVRKETLESYIKRLEKLEEIARSFKGVEKCYAIQAGRELRIMVKPDDVSDVLSAQITRDIARKIEGELTYPGQIKVTVIRELRYVEYAK
ncbi:MAG: ribonuclease Y [Nitrospirota bacterium]